MPADMKPIKLWGHLKAPNVFKVAIILEELCIPWESVFVGLDQVKNPPFVDLNPNGRLPAMEDPNTGLVLWESGAIIEYLVSTYDDGRLISPAPEAKWQALQFNFFQATGQGPYFGQFSWFLKFHQEKLDSAIERYSNEIVRVTSVLDKMLEGKDFLLGDKATYVDLVFIPYMYAIHVTFRPSPIEQLRQYKNYMAWYERLLARPLVKKTIEDRDAAIAKHEGA